MNPMEDPFVRYYADVSLKASTIERFEATKSAVMRAARHFGLPAGKWNVADVGCGAATQCAIWARDGHKVYGTDINEQLILLGKERTVASGLDISLTTGSATQLPWPDSTMDVCLCPELLEHVADWQTVIREAVRVLKPGGTLYLSTTNRLCPLQEEYDLIGYSWYPSWLKRHYERLAVTSRPEIVNHATYPAVNWFTYFEIQKHLRRFGMESLDRFDVAGLAQHSRTAKTAIAAIQTVPLLRRIAHVATRYTVVFASKARA